MAGFFKASGQAPPKRESTIPACGACGLHKKCKKPKQGYVGRGRQGILLVTSRPSKMADGDEILFGGASGGASHLRRVLEEFDVDIDDDCWSIGAIACYREGGDSTASEVDHCSPLFNNAIKELQPKVIITFSYSATLAAVTASGVSSPPPSSWQGWRIPDQLKNAWICPTYHPGEASGEKANEAIKLLFRQHVGDALKYKNRPWPNGAPNWPKDIKIIYEDTVAADAIREFTRKAQEEGDLVAWDYEANRLKPEPDDARLVCCALSRGRGDVKETLAYPWGPAARAATGEFLRSDIPKIAANLKFEDRWTRKEFGHRVRNWAWDTVVQGHVLDNRPSVSGVKFQSYVLLGQPSYDKTVKPYLTSNNVDGVNDIHKVAMSKLLLYCGMDALLEFKIAVRQAKLMGYPLLG